MTILPVKIGTMFVGDQAIPWSTTDWDANPICPDCNQRMNQGVISAAMCEKYGWTGPDAWVCKSEACIQNRKELKKQREAALFEVIVQDNDHLLKYGVDRDHIGCNFGSYLPKAKGDSAKAMYEKFVMDPKMNMLLTGNTGSGKTHLAVAFLRAIIKTGTTHCLFQNVSDFMMYLRNTYGDPEETDTEKNIINRFTALKLLILDDLGSEKPNDYCERVFYNIINKRLNDQKKTIITTNLSLPEIGELYGARIESRLGSYKSIEFTGKDYRKK